MKIDISKVDLPLKLKQDIWYVDKDEKEVVKLNVVGMNFTGIVLVGCLIKDIPYRKKVGDVMVTFNLSVEQPLFETEEEAIHYLESVK